MSSKKTKMKVKSKTNIKPVTLQDLIDIGDKKIKPSINFDINKMEVLLPSLKKLNSIIGMDSAKLSVAKIVQYYMLDLSSKNVDMMHTMIQGDSGTGKTMLARIIGEIYWKLGILDNNKHSHNVENIDEGEDEGNNDGMHRQLRKKQKVNYIEKDSYDYNDGFLVKDDSSDESYDNTCDNTCDDSESINSDDSTTNKTYKFIEASRTDCIDRYQGGTAQKTTKLIMSALGGVLFIDEAYSLGNTGAEDTYNKECIDTLTSLMEKYKGKIIIILGGYKHSMQESLMGYNQGLARRITFTITIDGYTAEQLANIYVYMIDNIDVNDPWKITASNNQIKSFFMNNYMTFPHYGGDIETLVFHTKMNHSNRLRYSDSSERKCINMTDLNNAFQDYENNRVI